MKSRTMWHVTSMALMFLAVSGCKKTESAPVAPVAAAVIPVATPALLPAASSDVTPPAPAATGASVAAISDPVTVNGVTLTATTGAEKSLAWALKQDEIKSDPSGQWAIAARASSSFGTAKEEESYAPWQATGAPNVDGEGDNTSAWSPHTADAGIEWLDLTFPNAVSATGVRIRESCGAGSIVKVDLIDTDNHAHALLSGADPTKGLNYLMFSFPKTAYKTNHVKITLATNLVPGWNQIDAVQLLGSDK